MYRKCESCIVCASVQGQGRRAYPPLKSIPVGEPFECIGMDFKQMDVSRHGYRYGLGVSRLFVEMVRGVSSA